MKHQQRCPNCDCETVTKIHTKINETPHPSLEVFIKGLGTPSPGDSPIYCCLESFEGRWQLVVWSDINKEAPTHRIDMSGAFETNN